MGIYILLVLPSFPTLRIRVKLHFDRKHGGIAATHLNGRTGRGFMTVHVDVILS
ncbi:MAG: hypothetical protein J0G95_08795 [Rhizobiales bacterium]|nr:hypothetical protein [Hyphomicrobiales bacterium]